MRRAEDARENSVHAEDGEDAAELNRPCRGKSCPERSLGDQISILLIASRHMRESPYCRLPASPGPPKVVLGLHVDPEIRRRPQCSPEAESHAGGDSCFAVQHAR